MRLSWLAVGKTGDRKDCQGKVDDGHGCDLEDLELKTLSRETSERREVKVLGVRGCDHEELKWKIMKRLTPIQMKLN